MEGDCVEVLDAKGERVEVPHVDGEAVGVNAALEEAVTDAHAEALRVMDAELDMDPLPLRELKNDMDAVADGEYVELMLTVPVLLAGGERELDDVTVRDGMPEAVTEPVRVGSALRVSVPEAQLVGDSEETPEGEEVGVELRHRVVVEETDPVTDAEMDALPLPELERDMDEDAVPDAAAETDREDDGELVKVAVPEMEDDAQGLVDVDLDTGAERLGLTELDGDRDGDADVVSVPLVVGKDVGE